MIYEYGRAVYQRAMEWVSHGFARVLRCTALWVLPTRQRLAGCEKFWGGWTRNVTTPKSGPPMKMQGLSQGEAPRRMCPEDCLS